MPLYQAVVLAIIQGLTEFLPVSSTAHLMLFPWVLGWNDPGLTFDVALHAGTLLAVVAYFWRTWQDLVTAALLPRRPPEEESGKNRKLFWMLVLGTIPGGLAGLLFEHAAETNLRQPAIVAAALIAVGLLMWAADRIERQELKLLDVRFLDSVIVGTAQAFAVIPGVSRSGVTMTAGLSLGMSRETSARYSFLLATPLIAGAALKKGLGLHHAGIPAGMRLPFLVGTLVAALVGYVVIAQLIRFLEHRTFKVFVIYRIALGVLVLLLEWGRRYHAG